MSGYYILNGKEAVETDATTWAKWFGTVDRIVAKDRFGDVAVSTVFLGLDHSFGDGGPDIFETMVFGGEYDQYQERYSTWDEAEKGHKKVVKMIKPYSSLEGV